MKRGRAIRLILLFAVPLFLFSGCSGPTPAPPQILPPPSAGMRLPAIELTTPTSDLIRNYLGLGKVESQTFTTTQIDCDILLIEIFSMYCPFCQREAPNVNNFFKLLQDRPKLSRQIKLIGIGIGNSAFEVGIFRNRYNVKFPLFADENFIIHNQLGRVRTPFFIAVANRGEKKNQILLTKLGDFSHPDSFLHSLTELITTATKGEK